MCIRDRHYSYHTTYIRPATICNDIQNIWYARIQHNGHRLQFVCHIEVDSVLIVVRVLVCAARNFVPSCASDSRGWHTYPVQQYRSTRRKSKYDHESRKCMPCGAIYTTDAYQCFVYIAYCSLCQTIWTRGLPTRDSSSITGLVLDKSFP